ncbi:MAG TPA: hypothetical protein VF885_11080 [Arthrobacter sp.]
MSPHQHASGVRGAERFAGVRLPIAGSDPFRCGRNRTIRWFSAGGARPGGGDAGVAAACGPFDDGGKRSGDHRVVKSRKDNDFQYNDWLYGQDGDGVPAVRAAHSGLADKVPA